MTTFDESLSPRPRPARRRSRRGSGRGRNRHLHPRPAAAWRAGAARRNQRRPRRPASRSASASWPAERANSSAMSKSSRNGRTPRSKPSRRWRTIGKRDLRGRDEDGRVAAKPRISASAAPNWPNAICRTSGSGSNSCTTASPRCSACRKRAQIRGSTSNSIWRRRLVRLIGRAGQPPISASHGGFVDHVRPSSRALASFEPAPGPATTMSVFFETDPSHLGAEAFGPRLGLVARHLLERAGEHHRLARPRGSRPPPLPSARP